MELTIRERIILTAILPERSDKMTQIICEDIIKKIAFSESEREKYKIEPFPNGWKWDDAYNGLTFSLEFSVGESLVLKEQSKSLDAERSITREMLSLIRKIDNL